MLCIGVVVPTSLCNWGACTCELRLKYWINPFLSIKVLSSCTVTCTWCLGLWGEWSLCVAEDSLWGRKWLCTPRQCGMSAPRYAPTVHVGTREYTPQNVINYFRWVHVYMLQQQIDYYIIAKLTIMTWMIPQGVCVAHIHIKESKKLPFFFYMRVSLWK